LFICYISGAFLFVLSVCLCPICCTLVVHCTVVAAVVCDKCIHSFIYSFIHSITYVTEQNADKSTFSMDLLNAVRSEKSTTLRGNVFHIRYNTIR